jgi:hypothetical protein
LKKIRLSGFPKWLFEKKIWFSGFPKWLFKKKYGLRDSRNGFLKKIRLSGFPKWLFEKKYGLRDSRNGWVYSKMSFLRLYQKSLREYPFRTVTKKYKYACINPNRVEDPVRVPTVRVPNNNFRGVRHCEYPFRTATKKCKDACQETSQTASEYATYKSVIASAAKQSIKFV